MTPKDTKSSDHQNDFRIEDFFLGELDDAAMSRLEAAIRSQPEVADDLVAGAMMIESVRAVGLQPIEEPLDREYVQPASVGWRSITILAIAAAALVLIAAMWNLPATNDSDETLQIAQAWLEQTSLTTDEVNPVVAPEIAVSENNGWGLDDSEFIDSIADDSSLDWIYVAIQLDAPEETDG